MILLTIDNGFIADFFNNIAKFVKAFGSYVVLGVGIVLIMAGVIQLAKGLAARKAQTNWLTIIICLLLGGFMAFGGWKLLTGDVWGKLGKDTLTSLNNSNTPTAITDVTDGTDTSSVGRAQTAINVIASGFVLPFGKALAVCVGVILIIMALWMLAKRYILGGKTPMSWARVLVLCVLGSVLFSATPTSNDSGWLWIKDMLVGGAKDSIIQIADGGAGTQTNGLTSPSFSGADPADVP